MSLRILLGLVTCNLIWSAHPVMAKYVLEDFSPAESAWLRYACAWAALLLAVAAWPFLARASGRRWSVGRRETFLPSLSRTDWGWLALMGGLAFCFSPLLQMTGLNASRATDNALIIAMEPLMALLLAAVLLGERIGWSHVASFGAAIAGFSLLSGLSLQRLSGGIDPHLGGNLLLLVSLIGEASHSVLSRKLVHRLTPPAIFGLSLTLGFALLTASVIGMGHDFPSFSAFTGKSALGVLWLGVFGTTLTYFYWVVALVRVPVASASLTLFVQPLAGAVWGQLFLGERLSSTQAAGGALIVAAVFAQAWREISAGAGRPGSGK